jgi:hypothetical protein
MRKVQPYRFVPQTSYAVEEFDRRSSGSGFPPPEPLFCADADASDWGLRPHETNASSAPPGRASFIFVNLDETAKATNERGISWLREVLAY